MKPIDNRQNKLHQLKKELPAASRPVGSQPSHLTHDAQHLVSGGVVYGLVKDVYLAAKIAQAAKHCHLSVHNFDRAAPLLDHAKVKKPCLVILDWDACEAEAFKFLKELRQDADLKAVSNVGYVSGANAVLKEEAQKSGCHRVYQKTEFMRDLELLLARYAQ